MFSSESCVILHFDLQYIWNWLYCVWFRVESQDWFFPCGYSLDQSPSFCHSTICLFVYFGSVYWSIISTLIYSLEIHGLISHVEHMQSCNHSQDAEHIDTWKSAFFAANLLLPPTLGNHRSFLSLDFFFPEYISGVI